MQARPSLPGLSTSGDASAAWEERRRVWLTEKPQNGERNGTSAGEATTAKLEKLVSPSNTKAEQAVADRAIISIKNRLADRQTLKEPMPLRVLVSLFYRSWLIDGTITEEMLEAERRGSTSDDEAPENYKTAQAPH
ncbi:MAG: hypothetical protein CYPHOPRED_003876 [Cyphobasidiales sp. Tagirdzhanova-0007]|nr:MAG: hypothetical protein CYPHOPRED_003876 [Cyphobasidiales sp. Tagirdzhanova-0007]